MMLQPTKMTVIEWLKFWWPGLAAFVIFACFLARVQAAVDVNTEFRKEASGDIEYVQRQNEEIKVQLREVSTDLKWFRSVLEANGYRVRIKPGGGHDER